MADFETAIRPLFYKTGLTDDDDWSSPSADEPAAARQHTLVWSGGLPARQIHKLQFGVTFRTAGGVEIAGTFDADFLIKVPAVDANGNAVSASASHPSARASWKRIGRVGSLSPTATPHPSAEPIVLDVGGDGTLAVRLYNITAVGAAGAYVTAQQWGGT